MSVSALLLLSVLTATPQKLAVPEWKTVNMPPDLAGFYAGEFARALRAQGFEVVTASDIKTLLGFERQKQLLGCSEDGMSCMAELGAALGCEAIVAADLARLDDSYLGTVRVLSATTGKTLASEPVKATGQRALAEALELAAERLTRQLRPSAPPPAVSARSLAWLPLVVGLACGGGAAATFAVAGSNFEAIPARGENDAVALARDGQALQVAGWALGGVGAAALVTAGVMFLAGGAPPTVTPQVSVVNGGAAVGVAGVLP